MVTINIPEKLVERINRVAERERRSLDEVVEAALEQQFPETPVEQQNQEPRPGTMAALIKAALEANIDGGESDVSARSREILDDEFADDLWERIQKSSTKDGNNE